MPLSYRYSLGKLTTVCPACGRRTFKPYVNNLTGQPLARDRAGRCNRQYKCGYHLSPREYFINHPMQLPPGWSPASASATALPRPRQPRSGAIDYISPEVARRSMRRYDINQLWQFLCRHYPAEIVERAAAIGLGTARRWGGAAVFWQIDRLGRVRTGKVMGYDAASGRRVKEPRPQVTWAHTLLGLRGFNAGQCFFGEVALGRPGVRTVLLVESEKTALVLTCELLLRGKEHVAVLATGGADGALCDVSRLSDPTYKYSALRGKRLVLLPDADMWQRWRSLQLGGVTGSRRVVPPGWLGLEGSQDIADVLIAGRRKSGNAVIG